MGQIAGDEIISELIRNADAGCFKVRYTVLVPCIFNVYLHPKDSEAIQPLAPFIQEEASRALSEHLAALNKRGTSHPLIRRFGLAGADQPEYKRLEKEWTVQFHADMEERLRPGEIEIYSEFGSSHPKEYGEGAMTTFVTRHRADEQTARVDQSAPGARGVVFAKLRYRDAGKDVTFAMTIEEIVIGRGGKAVWADLKIEGPMDVSREHCRIRRDPNTGAFFIKDLSRLGTVVNGAALPGSADRGSSNGAAGREGEIRLPSPAKIVLAGVVSLEFEAEPPA